MASMSRCGCNISTSSEISPTARWEKSILYKIDVLKLIATRIEPTLALVHCERGAVAADRRAAGGESPRATRAVRRIMRSASSRPSASAFRPSGFGLMLIILFSVKLDLLPVSGYGTTIADKLSHLVLPCLTIALSLSTVLTRSLRASNDRGSEIGCGDGSPRARHA